LTNSLHATFFYEERHYSVYLIPKPTGKQKLHVLVSLAAFVFTGRLPQSI